MVNRIKSHLFAMMAAVFLIASTLGLYWQNSFADREIPQKTESIVLGMGCFWGAEKRMSGLPGVVDVVSGYAGGSYSDPTYRKIIASEGRNDVVNYAEVVKVTFDPTRTSVEQILLGFWENHNPTQGNRQGNDVGSNYRSAIYYESEAQKQAALMTRDAYQKALMTAGFGNITTEIAPLKTFYPAEEYHQDYLVKHPNGYCGLGGTGVRFPSGINPDAAVAQSFKPLDPTRLSQHEQLIVFEAEHCPFCKLFREQVLNGWNAGVPITTTLSPLPPKGWKLKKSLWATPTTVLFRDGVEVVRYTGYDGKKKRFLDWLGSNTLPEG
jgi:methionine-S-sulfoxide reductase